jgi:FkbM family methyltransferase
MGKPTPGDTLEHLVEDATKLRSRWVDDVLHEGNCIVSGFHCVGDAAEMVERSGATVVAFHDLCRRLWTRRFRGKPVLRGALGALVPVVFAGVPTKRWFSPSSPGIERCLWHTPPPAWKLEWRRDPKVLTDHGPALDALFDSLNDVASREILASIVRSRIEGDTGYHRISDFVEYNHPVVHASPGDVVLDLGAYDGRISRMFAWHVGLGGTVLALEPSPSNLELLRRGARRHPFRNIRVVAKGAWSEATRLRFAEGQQSSSRLSKTGGIEVELTSVDAIVAEQRLARVDLIKMDVEGAEGQAILGAAATIRRFRPKLMISLYHRPNDLFELPALLRPMLENYDLFLGHHSFYSMETDLYAIPRERVTSHRPRGPDGSRCDRFPLVDLAQSSPIGMPPVGRPHCSSCGSRPSASRS